jgi:hypothetical protein
MEYLHLGSRSQKLQDDRDYHLINIPSVLYENQGSWLLVYVPEHKGEMLGIVVRITTRDKEFTIGCMQYPGMGKDFIVTACKRFERAGVVPAMLTLDPSRYNAWRYPLQVGIFFGQAEILVPLYSSFTLFLFSSFSLSLSLYSSVFIYIYFRFPMRSLHFSIDLFLTAVNWPWGRLSL